MDIDKWEWHIDEACPVCGGANFKAGMFDDGSAVVHCVECDHLINTLPATTDIPSWVQKYEVDPS